MDFGNISKKMLQYSEKFVLFFIEIIIKKIHDLHNSTENTQKNSWKLQGQKKILIYKAIQMGAVAKSYEAS